jgi:hypothetical protein
LFTKKVIFKIRRKWYHFDEKGPKWFKSRKRSIKNTFDLIRATIVEKNHLFTWLFCFLKNPLLCDRSMPLCQCLLPWRRKNSKEHCQKITKDFNKKNFRQKDNQLHLTLFSFGIIFSEKTFCDRCLTFCTRYAKNVSKCIFIFELRMTRKSSRFHQLEGFFKICKIKRKISFHF